MVIANPIFHGGLNVDHEPFPRPAQLPKRSTRLVGRAEELTWLDEATGEGEHVEGGLAVISGPAGAGKTALAQHWAHRVGSSFPDGHLWLDLGGDEAQRRMIPQAAIQHMLYALGIPPRQLLGHEQELTALFRTTLSDRRVLIILDNAASSAQVRPLLPSGPSVVLVTSRRRLDGLVAHPGAQLLELGMLDDGAAVGLLGETIGVQLHPSEREAADEIVRHCGYLPLAIKVVGARLRARRHHSGALGSLAERLREERHRLDLLHAEDIGVRTSLAITYEALTANTARAFRLLGLFPGPKIQRFAAAAMLKTSVEDADRSLEALAQLSLLDAEERDYWRFHDLVRLYAAELATNEDSPSDRQTAVSRVLDFYQSNATWADRLLRPKRVAWAPFTPVPRLATKEHSAALWSTAYELDNLVAIIRYGADNDLGSVVWRLALALGGFTYYFGGSAWATMRDCCRLALEVASRASDQQARAQLLDELGELAARLTDWDDAITQWELASEAWAELGDSTAEADCWLALTHMYLAVGSLEKAKRAAERCAELRRGQPGERIVLIALGLISIDLRRWESALEPLERALSLPDDEPDTGREFFATGFGEGDSHILSRHVDYMRSAMGYFVRGNWREAAKSGLLLACAMTGRPPVDDME